MPYVKPYNYVDGSVLDASGQALNDNGIKNYVNSGIDVSDIATSAFGFDSIARGELDTITNHHQFTTGEVYGIATPNENIDRSYFTANIKPVDMTGSVTTIWTPIFQTGTTMELEATGDIFINFGANFVSSSNSVQAHGEWDSKIILRYDDGTGWQDVPGTLAYTFEENNTAGSSGVAVPGTLIQGTADSALAFRRWVGWSWVLSQMPAADYSFAVFVNAKVDEGFASARSWTAEVFYT
jgi:hypothetical protein